MIKIINENLDKNSTNEQIYDEYETQVVRINKNAELLIDDIIETLNKLKSNITISYLKDELGNWCFDEFNNLEIPSEEEYYDDKIYILKAINKFINKSDETIQDELREIVNKVFIND